LTSYGGCAKKAVRLEAQCSVIVAELHAHSASLSHLTASPAKDTAILIHLLVPKTGGMNTTKVNVVRWLKQEGEALKQGDPVVELETEKVNYELDSPVEGVLLKIVSREPAEVPVGGLLAYIGNPGDAAPTA